MKEASLFSTGPIHALPDPMVWRVIYKRCAQRRQGTVWIGAERGLSGRLQRLSLERRCFQRSRAWILTGIAVGTHA